MNHECEGSRREVPTGPRPNEATSCPVCGRETKVDVHEGDGDTSFTIAPHRKIVEESR
jgi:hypothetical protein